MTSAEVGIICPDILYTYVQGKTTISYTKHYTILNMYNIYIYNTSVLYNIIGMYKETAGFKMRRLNILYIHNLLYINKVYNNIETTYINNRKYIYTT